MTPSPTTAFTSSLAFSTSPSITSPMTTPITPESLRSAATTLAASAPTRDFDEVALDAALACDTRASYLAWVVAWKACYRDVSAELRAARGALKAAQREGARSAERDARRARWRGKDLATALLALRAHGKRRSAARRGVPSA